MKPPLAPATPSKSGNVFGPISFLALVATQMVTAHGLIQTATHVARRDRENQMRHPCEWRHLSKDAIVYSQKMAIEEITGGSLQTSVSCGVRPSGEEAPGESGTPGKRVESWLC